MADKDVTEQAIRTLSEQIVGAVQQLLKSAPFVTMRTGIVRKVLKDNKCTVSFDDRLIDLPVYGSNSTLKAGEQVYLVSPQNSKNLQDMFILGK